MRRGGADVSQVGPLQAVDQVGLHGYAGIGDGSGNQRILQRGHRDVLLADARHSQRGGVRDRARGGLGNLQWNGVGDVVEAERLGGAAQRVGAGEQAQLDEGGVARPGERLTQRDGFGVDAGGAAVVFQGGGAVRQWNRGRGGELFVYGGAVLQRGRGGDHLECRTGWIGLGDV